MEDNLGLDGASTFEEKQTKTGHRLEEVMLFHDTPCISTCRRPAEHLRTGQSASTKSY